MVKELHTLLVNAKIESPYILVGHSFGGAVMRLFAHTYPDEVSGMVLVDAAPDDLFLRIPLWRKAIGGKLGLYRTLAPLGSLGLLTFTPGSIPSRGMPEDVLTQYRAIAVSTGYFQTGIMENSAFENNLAEERAAHINLGDMPLIVIRRGYWDPMPGFSDTENQQAWQKWQEMQTEMLSLSSHSKLIVATKSEHNIQFQQPQLIIDAIKDVMEAGQMLIATTSYNKTEELHKSFPQDNIIDVNFYQYYGIIDIPDTKSQVTVKWFWPFINRCTEPQVKNTE